MPQAQCIARSSGHHNSLTSPSFSTSPNKHPEGEWILLPEPLSACFVEAPLFPGFRAISRRFQQRDSSPPPESAGAAAALLHARPAHAGVRVPRAAGPDGIGTEGVQLDP